MSSDTQCLESEPFLAIFALEFVKSKVLVDSYFTCTETCENKEQLNEITELSHKINIKNVMATENLCAQLKNALVSRLRILLKLCRYRKWPVEHYLLLAPNWLRIVEAKVHLMPSVMKSSDEFIMKSSQTPLSRLARASVLYLKLIKNGYKAAQNGRSLYGQSVICSVAKDYGVSKFTVLSLWRRTCELVKWLIIHKSVSIDFFPYYNIAYHIADYLLLCDTSFKVVTEESFSNEEEVENLSKLYKLVIKYNIETLLRNKSPDLGAAWLKLCAVYSCEAKTSLIYLQRCWYELKWEARCRVLSYYRVEQDSVPHSLLLSIISNFSYINSEPLPKWSKLVKMGLVVELKDVAMNVCEEALSEVVEDYDVSYYMFTVNQNESEEEDKLIEVASTTDISTMNEFTNSEENLNHKTTANKNTVPNECVDKSFETKKASAEETFSDHLDNSEEAASDKIDIRSHRKLLKETSVPLIRCDHITAWKRYYRKGTINVRNIDAKKLLPKQLLKTNRINKSTVKRTNTDGDYSLIDLRTNPDFNVKLKRLSKAFLNIERNLHLLNLCKPVTVVLDRTDTSAVSFKPAPLRKAKKIELPDIAEVRKINSTILTAEVAPVVVQSPSQVAQGSSCTSPSEGQCTVTTGEMPNHIKKMMKICKNDPDINDAQLKILNDMWARTETTTLLTDGDKSDDESNVNLYRCDSKKMEVDEPHRNRHMNELKENYVQESREIAHATMFILQKKPLNTQSAKGEEDYGAIMSTNISTYDDCLFFDGTEPKTKDIETERLEKKRRVKRSYYERNKKKKKEEKIKTVETEEKDHKCPDAYDEWTRQKNLGLKYFSLPNLVKPDDKQEDRNLKTSAPSQANTSNTNDVACPNVIKAFYKTSYPRVNLKLNVPLILKKKPKIVFCEPVGQATTQVNAAAEAPVVDLTEMSGDLDPPLNVSNNTVVKAINLSNANMAAGRPAAQRTCDENKALGLRFISACDKPARIKPAPRKNILPVITSVHSLAHKFKNGRKMAENSASVCKEQHHPQKLEAHKKPVPPASDTPLVPLAKVLPGGLISLVPIVAPVTNNASKQSLPTVTVSPMLKSRNEQSPWLPLPAASSTSIPQNVLQNIFKLSLPNQEESSPISKSGHNLAQVRTINTGGGRYFVLVPESMQHDAAKTAELPLKKGQSASKTIIKKPSAPRSTAGARQPDESISRSELPSVDLTDADETSVSQYFCKTPVGTWVQNKMAEELKILRVDAEWLRWTPKKSYLLITESDLVCEMPIYWSVDPPETRCRILFPAEKDGFVVYNPKTVHVSKTAAIGTTAFAKWVRSVLELDAGSMLNSDDGTDDTEATIADVNAGTVINEGQTKSPSKDKAGAINETNTEMDVGDKPVVRLKVKSFAKITDDECDQTFPPERVCLQGKTYMKVSDEPLKYAQVLTVVSSAQEARCLSTLNAKFYILPNDSLSVCVQAQDQPPSQSN